MKQVVKFSGRKGRWAGLLAGALLASALFFTVPQEAWASARRPLKVGYTGAGGLHVDEDGNYAGYVVDFLNEVAEHTGWRYEYVYGSWQECSEWLAAGELDLMGMVGHTEEREETLLFSELPMADDYTALYAAAGSDIYYQDYAALNGCRVAVVADTIHEDAFVEYAHEMGIKCKIVHMATEPEMERALKQGLVELAVMKGLSSHEGLKLVDRFGLERTYFVTGKHNKSLMRELDAAIQLVRLESPRFISDLTYKHYGAGSAAGLNLTREEQEYLSSAGPVVVKGLEGRRPLGYVSEDGEFTGVLADYLDMLGAVSGLEFIHQKSDILSLEDNFQAMTGEGYALIFTEQDSLALAGMAPAIYRSDPLLQTHLVCVRRYGDASHIGPGSIFAINGELEYLEELILAWDPGFVVEYYDTAEACMDAVADGHADITIQDEHVEAHLLPKPKFASTLVRVEGETIGDNLCLYAPREHKQLVSIINKTLTYLDEEQRANAVANAMIDHSYEYELEDMLYEYGPMIVGFSLMLLALIVLTAMLFVRVERIREQKRENEALQERIQRDELTGVYNRTGFFRRAREMIDGAGEDAELYMVRLNVCRFKLVNELYGTENGDALLCEMGRDLNKMSLEQGFVVGRFTADYFYLCISRENFERNEFPARAPAPWLGMDIILTYGVYPITEREIHISAMCDRADMASRDDTDASEHIRYYSDDERQRLLREQEIENDMELALGQRQFHIYVQPKYDVDSGRIAGGEALVRWMHPEKGLIMPGRFIALFERNGFIRKLDYYVWEECCRFIAETKARGLPVYPLSTNVSRIHFYGPELVERLAGLMEKYGVSPADLQLEITETACGQDGDVVFEKCRQLRQMGFKIAMDDFGSGYSSLNMLKEMPLDIIKMDLRFLSGEEDADQKEKGRSILGKLIELSHALGIGVVVEGLETADQRDFIRRLGHCIAQGYFFSRPVPAEQYAAMLAEDAENNHPEG